MEFIEREVIMTMRRAILPAISILGLFCLALFAGPAAANDIEHLTLDVNIGGSELVEIREPSQRMKILISNSDIIGARPLRPNLVNIYNLGKKVGFSRVTVWDDASRQVRAIIDVSVNLDLTPLKQKLSSLYPHEDIKVHASETGVVLSGTVSGSEVVEQVIRLTKTFLPEKAEASAGGKGIGESGSGITNLLNVGGVQQVMLEVKFAEVTRSSSKKLAGCTWHCRSRKQLHGRRRRQSGIDQCRCNRIPCPVTGWHHWLDQCCTSCIPGSGCGVPVT